MGGSKGPQRGRKTHRADIRQNRGEPREAEQHEEIRMKERDASDQQENLNHEHPTRMNLRNRADRVVRRGA